MSAFTGALRIATLDADCRVWRLEEPLQYEIGALGSGALIIVPKGFETDGASIPRLLQGILPAWGRWSRAAIIHDYLCRAIDQASPVGVRGWGIVGQRKQADDIFHEAMIVSDVPRPLAFIMWAAVRLADRWPVLREASA
ncbi:MAG: DUF1353 domain-containing protein [Rhabdaerophilum sp.]